MSRSRLLAVLTAVALGTQVTYTVARSSSSSVAAKPVTFNKDVLPILQQHCVVCHRTGEIAPMSFMTYESVRPWAKAIKAAVINRQMPPWFADPHFGEFRNAPKMTEADINTLAAWADTGAQEGAASDKPEFREFVDGWRIQPDVVVSMPQAFEVPAEGPGEIRAFLIRNPFNTDIPG